ncbi:ATP synthase subunit I [Cytobacillus sp. Hz8]|uniref:ATP synthase subunit I n=1 Tax=Cytobacillus sp. Hz8 TaxID=3347168 RepID=UPI0035DDBAC9
MPELHAMYIRERKYILFLLSFYVLGWGFTSYKTIFLGLILGTSLSLFNLWSMASRVQKFGDAVVQGKKARSLGMFLRMFAAVLGVAIALKFPEYFHLISVILGLMTTYVVIMIDLFFQTFQKRK